MTNVSTQPTCLVMMQDTVVAQDLALTISDCHPDARVIVAATPADALAQLAAVPQIWLAFVSARPRTFAQSAFAKAISARGGKVVMLGVEAEQAGPTVDWCVLPQPFTTEVVVRKLLACGRQGVRGWSGWMAAGGAAG